MSAKGFVRTYALIVVSTVRPLTVRESENEFGYISTFVLHSILFYASLLRSEPPGPLTSPWPSQRYSPP
jgi:hypothetical protein